MKFTEGIKLVLAGPYSEENLLKENKINSGWNKVDYRGFVGEDQKNEIFRSAKAGLVTFLDYPNHIHAQPNKMFEYMGAGLPVIASNFELWKNIIEKNKCGICVNPRRSS